MSLRHKNQADRANLARIYADAILRDPLGDPRMVHPDPIRGPRSPVRLRWIVLGTLIAVGVVALWA